VTLTNVQWYHDTGGFDSIPGWMHYSDLMTFGKVLEEQLRDDVNTVGDLLEIGCYQGKSAIAMGYGLRKDEALHVVDVFGEDTSGIPTEGMEAYQGLGVASFEANYRRFHPDDPPVTHVCASTDENLRKSFSGREFRFIHIDGGHAYDVVAKDISLAVSFAAGKAVIALDDYRTAHTPGTAAAIWAAVAHGELFPFALTEVKMYATTKRSTQTWWRDAIVRSAAEVYGDYDMHGLNVVRIR
jgi:hypothetical protein